MLGEQELQVLLDRAVHRDQDAWRQLVGHLESVIRRAARLHLPATDPLRRRFDSLDISQSILRDFFAKWGTGAIRLQSPDMLRALLRQMTAQKFIDKSRHARALRRDYRREEDGRAVFAVLDLGAGPDEIAANRELYQEVRRLLTSRERAIADLWVIGMTFPEIAARMKSAGGKAMQPNAVRMALERAFRRIASQLPQDWHQGYSTPLDTSMAIPTAAG